MTEALVSLLPGLSFAGQNKIVHWSLCTATQNKERLYQDKRETVSIKGQG